jgi:hypothetical protein
VADTTALARLEKTASMQITQPQQLAERIREWQQVAHVLSPAVSISALAPQHVIAPSVVVLDPRVDDQGIGVDTYHSNLFHRGQNERSLTKVALNKIASAAGASYTTVRTDDRTIPNYWEMRARLTYTDFDGSARVIERTAEVDLRDGSPQVAGMKSGQIAQARRFGLRLCEAKACNAAARDTWGIPSKYDARDLEKPFVALRVSFQPNMNDPAQARMVTERRLMGTAALYPQASRPEPDVIDVEAVRETAAETSQGRQAPAETQQQARQAQQEQRREPEKPNGPVVVKVEAQSGKTADKGRPYTRYFVTLDDGREAFTFDEAIGKFAEKARDQKIVVEMVDEPGKKGGQVITELKPWEPGLFEDAGVTDDDLPAAAGGKY